MKIATALLLTISALSMWVGAAGNFRHTYPLDAVSQVQLDAYGHVELTQGTADNLEVIAGEDITPYLQFTHQNDTLNVVDTRTHSTWYKTKQWWQQMIGDHVGDQEVRYHVTLKNPQALTLNGHFAAHVHHINQPSLDVTFNGLGELRAEHLKHEALALTANGTVDLHTDDLGTKSFKLTFNGTGDLEALGMDVQQLTGHLNGLISCTLAGKAQSIKWVLEGSGDCSATRLQAHTAQLHVAGDAHMTVNVKAKLAAHTEGQGRITYHGHPKTAIKGNGIRAITGGYQARTYY
ncbi:GIN domain-containing protein [Simiduia aestuariiviva]|uniref:Putative auto-transporter adhesin head GIN domain-containing protein n=1 Tax=Simiduia aestuariiviva TaxID=1510459 RepID=A0A839UMI5_9GAMM|nr:hypothetical protein [Simiduia aestuariiviva]